MGRGVGMIMKRKIFALIRRLSRPSISPGVPDAIAEVGRGGPREDVTVACFATVMADLVNVLGRPEPDENKGFCCQQKRKPVLLPHRLHICLQHCGKRPGVHSNTFKSKARSTKAVV